MKAILLASGFILAMPYYHGKPVPPCGARPQVFPCQEEGAAGTGLYIRLKDGAAIRWTGQLIKVD